MGKRSIVYLFAIVLGAVALVAMSAGEQAKEAARGAADAAREAVDEAMEDAEEGKEEEATEELVEVQGRFVDQGDGTVRDNTTGLIWLRNASCEDLGPRDWESAKLAVAALATGKCGLTDGSLAGAWRLPTIEEFCSAWSGGVEICPSTAASDSLIDSSLSGAPFVPNAAGTGLWSEGDAFVGVQSSFYWSATEGGADNAWYVDLDDGGVGLGGKGSNVYVWPVRSGQ